MATSLAPEVSDENLEPISNPMTKDDNNMSPRKPLVETQGSDQQPMGNCNNQMFQKARTRADAYTSKWHTKHDDAKWGYGRDRGPSNWWVYYPMANGQHQSPVDIKPEDADFDPDLVTYPLQINYTREEPRTLVNTGHAWQVNVGDSRSVVTGGPVQTDKYYLHQFHMHWGDLDSCGSEHTVQGSAFSGELHFVHYNAKYQSFRNACTEPDGLLVVAVFVKACHSGTSSAGLSLISSNMGNISYKDSYISLRGLDVKSLFPPNCSKYWTYKGSLTTPPCLETVQWLVMFEPIMLHPQEFHTFRSLHNHQYGDIDILDAEEFGGRIVKNYRPIQNLYGRNVSCSEPVFTGYPEFDEQFHKQHLFTTSREFKCQFHRQGLL